MFLSQGIGNDQLAESREHSRAARRLGRVRLHSAIPRAGVVTDSQASGCPVKRSNHKHQTIVEILTTVSASKKRK